MGVDKSSIIQNAQKFTAKGQLDKAIGEWKKLIAETPNDGNVYNTIGDLHLKSNSSKDAIQVYLKAAEVYHQAGFALKTIAVYKKIIKVDPHHLETQVRLADLNAERGLTGNAIEDYLKVAKEYAKQHKIRESLEIYRKIANLDPTNVNIQLKLSEMFMKEGLKQEAIDELMKAAENCSSKGKDNEAEALYQRVLQIDPQNVKAQNRGREPEPVAEQAAEVEPALEGNQMAGADAGHDPEASLREAVARPEATLEQRRDLGFLLLGKGDLEGSFHELQKLVQDCWQEQECGMAIQAMQEYLKRDSKKLEAKELLAQSYEKSGIIDRAVEEYVNVIDLLVREEQSMTGAMHIFNRIKELDPQNPAVQKLEVRFGSQAEQPAPAVEISAPAFQEVAPEPAQAFPSAEPAVEEAPSTSAGGIQSYLTEAEVYLKYGLSAKALEQLQAAASVAPNHPEVHTKLKELFKIEGRTDEFISECLLLAKLYADAQEEEQKIGVLQELLQASPDHPEAKAMLGGAPVEIPEPAPEPVDPGVSAQEALSLNEAAVSEISRGTGSLTAQMIQEVEERFAEAEFYYQQGLKEEAVKLYRKVVEITPGHPQAQARLTELGGSPAPAQQEPTPPRDEVSVETSQRRIKNLHTSDYPEGDVNLTDLFKDDLFGNDEAEPEPEPADLAQKELESLFTEFKRGIQEQFGDKDYETHYNLGIAYKEMGLLREAIEEFQLASNGDAMFIDAVNMLAICYKAREDYEHAIEQIEAALMDERCTGGHAVGLKYELAELYDLTNRKEEALQLFDEIYQLDQSFKDVAEKYKQLKNGGGETAAPQDSGNPEPPPKKKKVSYL